ncbi:hypothetical protein K438DRAFT_2011742 [Mycena galopus ATCC 62051]|nr:hypothetical protein K438DRAFT_2011742 [Mycena galopus ATCC 62051]
MSDSKSSPESTTGGPSLRRTASIDTLPQYTSGDEGRRRSLEDAATPLPPGWFCHLDPHSNHHFYVDMNSTPTRSVWHHPRHEELPPPPPTDTASTASSKRRSFLGKLKEKMIVSKADLEAERHQKEAKERELLSRYSRRRGEVLAELDKDGGKTSEYVGPPASPYGGEYRALMPGARGLNNNLAGWLA